MKIQFKETPEQLELIAAMGSKDRNKAAAAQFAFANLIAPTLGTIYQQADTTGFLYRDFAYNTDDDPSFPIDLFSDVAEGHFSIWSAPKPGGLPSNHISQAIDEVKFTTYRLDSAWSINSKYARKMRLPIVAKALQRLVQEVLLKTNYSAWSVLLAALSQATHTIGGTSLGHVFAANTAGTFNMDDFNQLQTYFRRLNSSWVGGTPVGGAGKPTDMIVSPEMLEKFRAMAYNPINTKANSAGTALGASSAAVTLPEAQRAALYNSGGVPEFYGVNLIELLELGKSQDYQTLFAEFIGSTDLPKISTKTASGVQFSASTNELALIVDATKDMAYRAIATDSDTGSVFSLEADDQYQKRAEKLGWYGGIEEGRVVTDTRFIAALVV